MMVHALLCLCASCLPTALARFCQCCKLTGVVTAAAFAASGKRVIKKAELRGAIREMLDTEGPYLLEVMVPVSGELLWGVFGGGRLLRWEGR
jgi:hypothetical protein